VVDHSTTCDGESPRSHVRGVAVSVPPSRPYDETSSASRDSVLAGTFSSATSARRNPLSSRNIFRLQLLQNHLVQPTPTAPACTSRGISRHNCSLTIRVPYLRTAAQLKGVVSGDAALADVDGGVEAAWIAMVVGIVTLLAPEGAVDGSDDDEAGDDHGD
jgi:hypothetical protein